MKAGIRIIATFFILDALWIFYDIARVWLSGQSLEYPSIYGAIPLFSLIGGIGLWHKRGWGRNFGLASSYILLLRGLPYLLSCWAKHDTGYLVGAIFSFLLALSTGSYLYRKPIRRIFPESPASLSFVGFTLALYGFTQHSGGTGVIYLCYVLALAGVVIGVRAVWLTNNSEGNSRSRSEDADASLLPDDAPQEARHIRTGRHAWYIVRHWQGEIALPLAYWGNTVLMTLCLMVGFSAAPWADLGIKTPQTFSILLISLWLTMATISVWQFVGVWRSATRYIEQGRPQLWGNLARVAVILGLLAGSMEFVSVGIPQFKEYVAMAAGKDALGSYQLRVSRDGTKLAITGPMSVGLTEQVRLTLDANRSIRIIHLNSIGGRINEARRLRDLIASRRLTTYTASGCLSACTLAFIGGRTRLIARGAALGFHQYSFPGVEGSTFRAEYEKDKQDWLSRGIATAFVNKAFAAPGSQMWKPSHQELFEAGVLTDYPERDDDPEKPATR